MSSGAVSAHEAGLDPVLRAGKRIIAGASTLAE